MQSEASTAAGSAPPKYGQAVRTTLAGLGPEYRVCSSSADVDIVLASSASLLAVFLDCNTMG